MESVIQKYIELFGMESENILNYLELKRIMCIFVTVINNDY